MDCPNQTDTWNLTTVTVFVRLDSVRLCFDFHVYEQLLHAVIEYDSYKLFPYGLVFFCRHLSISFRLRLYSTQHQGEQ